MSHNPQPNPHLPFQWSQLTPHQQRQLTHLLARLLTQYLAAQRPLSPQEAAHEQPSQNR